MTMRLLLLYGSILLLVLLRVVLTPPPQPLPDGAVIHARVRLTTTPQLVSNHQQLKVLVRGQQVTLITPQFSDYNYGDLLDVSGTIKVKVLSGKRTVYSIYFPKITKVTDASSLPYRMVGFVRERVQESYSTYLDPETAGLLEGIVFGISTSVPKNLKSAFQVTGVTHVIAASGMNVTLLAAFLLPVLLRLFSRRVSLVLLIGFLAFYALLSGMSASIVRATLMASIGFIGLLLGRQRTAFVSFFLTGCIMVGITPSVLTDIGFQLSFASTAGMLLVRPLFPSFSRIPLLNLVEEDVTSTIAAQITTLPILIYYFHSFGLLAILVNTLVLWTIAPMMVIGSLAAVIGLVSTTLGGVVAFLCLPFLSYFLLVITLFASFTPVVTLTELPLTLLCGYYLVVFSVVWIGKAKQRISPQLSDSAM